MACELYDTKQVLNIRPKKSNVSKPRVDGNIVQLS